MLCLCLPVCSHTEGMRTYGTCGTCTCMSKGYKKHEGDMTSICRIWVPLHARVHCFVYLVDQAVLLCSPMPQLRTQDLALFEELQGSAEGPLSLTIQDPTPGTIACRLGVLSEPLVRKYFYLNGAPRCLSALGAVSSVGWSGTPDTCIHGRVMHGGVASCQDTLVHGGQVEWSRCSLMPGSSGGSGAHGVKQGPPDT